MENPVNSLLRTIRLRAIWLLVLPFFYFARPTADTLVWGFAVAVLGLTARAWAAGHIRKDQELATGGPYAHTRNPLYLGSFLVGLGVTVAGARPLFLVLFALFFFAIYPAQAKVEAAFLSKRFPEAYDRYAKTVPLLVPRPWPDSSAGERTHFLPARYLQNREWEAGLGVLAGFGGLISKLIWF